MLTVVRDFYVIFMQYMPCFVNAESNGLVSVEYFLVILQNLWIMGECQAVFSFWKRKHL